MSQKKWGDTMARRILYWQIAGFWAVALLGTGLHFLFDWTGGSAGAALVSAVNESTWEHMKLLFWPMMLVSAVEYARWGRRVAGFWSAKLVGTLTGLGLIPVIFYTCTGALGISADWFYISIFFLAAGAAFWRETQLLQRQRNPLPEPLAILLLGLLGLVFLFWTFQPPQLPIFQDPLNGSFGFFNRISAT